MDDDEEWLVNLVELNEGKEKKRRWWEKKTMQG
jgi:hypothetical protein